jgi:ATP-dependent RNA helicase DHX29
LFSILEPLDDCDDPNIHYARLKLELDGASTGRNVKKSAQAHPRPFIEELHARLKAVKSHYLFDERDAEAHYRSERQKAEAASLQARLRGSPGIASMPPGTPTSHKPKGLPRQPQAKEVREDPDDFFDSTGEDGDGGLFEILEAMPPTEVSETGVTVTIRDMSLPKGKFERTSKTFLQGAIDKLDSFAVTTYRRISGASRAIRASLSVRWSSGKVSEWAMEDVACHDMTQAEQYIATVALHALTFPMFEGFSPANLARGNTQTFFRLLTPAFRDFWDELEAKRKTSEDATNRAVWSKLKKIVEARGDQGKVRLLMLQIGGYCSAAQTVDRGLRTVTQNTETFNSEKGFRERVNSAQIMQASEARRSSPSYRDMLVSLEYRISRVVHHLIKCSPREKNYPSLNLEMKLCKSLRHPKYLY